MLSRTMNEIFRLLSDFDFTDEPMLEQPFSQVIYDKDSKTWTVEVELPGMDKKDVDIKVVDSNLVVLAKNDEREFSVRYYLGKDIDKDSIEASMENGLLIIKAKLLTPEEKVISIN